MSFVSLASNSEAGPSYQSGLRDLAQAENRVCSQGGVMKLMHTARAARIGLLFICGVARADLNIDVNGAQVIDDPTNTNVVWLPQRAHLRY
jgi:hypothetical protein